MSDEFTLEVKLFKCWVRDGEDGEWEKRWSTAQLTSNGYALCGLSHDQVPKEIDLKDCTTWGHITRQYPNRLRDMSHRELKQEIQSFRHMPGDEYATLWAEALRRMDK